MTLINVKIIDPISLLSNLSKLYELLMYNRIWSFLEESNILFEKQFGFRTNHSTNHALLWIVEEILKNLEKNFIPVEFVWI